MKFEVSERIITNAEKEKLLNGLEEQFKKVSQKVIRTGDSITVKLIEASFGSINRSDTTTIDLKETEDGFLVLANVNYRPSIAFWIILILTLFTWVFWLIPIVFYLIQKKTVQAGIKDVFDRINNEFMSSGVKNSKKKDQSNLEQLEKLAALKEKGAVTEDEFQTKKKELLGFC